MKKKDMENIGLPKWPAFVVIGEPVTKEQAIEIIIRTCDFPFCSNERDFVSSLRRIVGLKDDKYDNYDYDEIKKIKMELGILDLDYIQNKVIVSCWIGGPHGWIDWNGNVGCHNYNIGKWPTVEGVLREWRLVAKTFPFLNLTCQLFSGEVGEKNIIPVIQYNIKNGSVSLSNPKKRIANPYFKDEQISTVLLPGGEIGCTLSQFKEAVNLVKNKIKNESKKYETK